jgi:hypothetical protein
VSPQRQRELAAELKALPVALIIAPGTITIRAARDGAPNLPVVMINAGDPVGAGFVASLARPGGDLTGTSAAGEEVLAKQLELLSDGLRLDRIDVAVEGELEGAIARANGGALVVLGDPMFGRNRVHIIELTLRSQVPSVFGGREDARPHNPLIAAAACG